MHSVLRSIIHERSKQPPEYAHSLLCGQELPPALVIKAHFLKSRVRSIKHILKPPDIVWLPWSLAVCMAQYHPGEGVGSGLTGPWCCRTSYRGIATQVRVVEHMKGFSSEGTVAFFVNLIKAVDIQVW